MKKKKYRLNLEKFGDFLMGVIVFGALEGIWVAMLLSV